MIKAIIAIGLLIFSPNLSKAYSHLPVSNQTVRVSHPSSLEYKIIPSYNKTWGYDILKDGKVFIHQPHIPGLPGKEGFREKKDAAKVAELVIAKLQRGEMPPTISPEEMTALKITFIQTGKYTSLQN